MNRDALRLVAKDLFNTSVEVKNAADNLDPDRIKEHVQAQLDILEQFTIPTLRGLLGD